MPDPQPQSAMVIQADIVVYQQLQGFARSQRLVFFAGLPGTGKSLLSHQLTHLAVAAGKTVHLLQWDVARPVFEAHPSAQRYPTVDGVTHGVIRMAVGRWARHALVQWQQDYPESHHLLIGETPFIGHRFIELARRHNDATEELLRGESVFVIPVPSYQVRHYIETERHRRRTNPVHPQETEDAPSHVLQALWQELVRMAPSLGLSGRTGTAPAPYDPVLYQRVYERLLRHRRVQVLPVNTLLPTATLSVYTFAVERFSLTPSAEEVRQFIHAVEQDYPQAAALQEDIEQWYLV
jgi:hypothetical protein